MASAQSQLQLAFSVNLGGLETGMRQAASTVRNGSQQIRTALEDTGRGAESAGRGMDGLSRALLGYRREEVQQARSTKFFAAELAALLPVSSGVAGAFGRLAGAMVGGVGIGLAFEGLKLVAEGVTSSFREQREETERLAAAQNALADAVRKVRDAAAERVVVASTSGLPDELQSAMARQRQAIAEQGEAKRAVERAKAKLERATGITDVAGETPGFGLLQSDEYKAAKEELRKAQDAYERATAAVRAAGDARGLALRAQEIRDRNGGVSPSTTAGPRATAGARGQEAWEADLAMQLVTPVGPSPVKTAALPDFQGEMAGAFARNTGDAIDRAMKEKDRLLKEDQRRTEEYARGIESALSPMVSGFNNIFVGIADGSIKSSEAMSRMGRNIAASMIGMFAQVASKQISAHLAEMAMGKQKVAANAAVAGSGAAASQASIPFIGPVLAMAAMAAMQFAVMGLQALFSAAGGFDVPAGLAPITQLHPKEMVLPAEHAETIRRLGKEGGGSGSLTFAPNVQAGLDPRDVRRVLRENVDAFVDTYREAQRRRIVP